MSIPIIPFTCNVCNRTYKSIHKNNKVAIDNHNKTKRHTENEHRKNYNEHDKRNYDKTPEKYECKICDKALTSKKSVIDAHNLTKSHIKKAETYVNNDIDYEPNQIDNYWCNDCKKEVCQNTKFNINRHFKTQKHQAILRNQTYGV